MSSISKYIVSMLYGLSVLFCHQIARAETESYDPGSAGGWRSADNFYAHITGSDPQQTGKAFCDFKNQRFGGVSYPYPSPTCYAYAWCSGGAVSTLIRNTNPCPDSSWMANACMCYRQKPKVPPKLIVIDPGHGGTRCAAGGTKIGGDTGTTGPTYKDTEHGLALAIGLKLRDKLLSKGHKVIMTRTTAVCPSLQQRVTVANDAKADLFVSIHFNGVANPKANGSEVFGLPDVEKSWQLATSTSTLLSSTLGTADRGAKTKNLYVVRKATMPSVLAEVAFLTNVRGDEDIMHRQQAPEEAASAIFSGIDNLFSN